MIRDWEKELSERVDFIKGMLASSGANGVIYGNSGGKDCTLVGILCKKATNKVLSVIMPCQSSRNFGIDREHAMLVAQKYSIECVEIDLSEVKTQLTDKISAIKPLPQHASMNINPRLRMATLYALGNSYGYIVSGTGNRSEATMGYFTKWGDGAYDFNPIADLTVTEIFEFLRFLGAPTEIIDKAPSAGLFEGQTDEGEMGITYAQIDEYLLNGTGTEENIAKIKKANEKATHKLNQPPVFKA